MPTNYPTGLDTFTNPASGDNVDNPPHSAQHADANDAIEAIQNELGTRPAGTSGNALATLNELANDVPKRVWFYS